MAWVLMQKEVKPDGSPGSEMLRKVDRPRKEGYLQVRRVAVFGKL